MVQRILVGLAFCALAIFILFWVLTGGFSRAVAVAKGLQNPVAFFTGSATGTALKLPWQPDVLVPTADLSSLVDDTPSPGNDLAPLSPSQAKTFGTPSPYRGQITFGRHDFGATSLDGEYVQIQSEYRNSSAISLQGWTIQSAVSGARVAVPLAASPYVHGVLNNVIPVSMQPGASAIISSGTSPVGISFRENVCTGFLSELQTFTPELQATCPFPGDELPVTSANLQTYGEACIDYVKNIPPCHFPGANQTANVSNACKAFAANALSYNGCVNHHKPDADFALNSWRLYLASGVQLWGRSHDVIRLLDAQGRTVDVLTY